MVLLQEKFLPVPWMCLVGCYGNTVRAMNTPSQQQTQCTYWGGGNESCKSTIDPAAEIDHRDLKFHDCGCREHEMVEVRTEGCRRDWRSCCVGSVSVQLWGKKAQGDLVCVHRYLMGGSKEEGDSFQWCSVRPQNAESTNQNSGNSHHKRKNQTKTTRVAKDWKSLPREGYGVSSLKILKKSTGQ